MSAEHDVLIVGGGIVGLSVAVHAARAGLATVLVEAGGLGGVSTQRSGALVRTHYDDPGSARLALAGLEDFELFSERYGGPAGFVATGFAYVPDAGELADGSFRERVEMLRDLGVGTEILDAAQARSVDPAIALGDGEVVAYEPRSGYADPAQTTATLAAAARAEGADLCPYTKVAHLLCTDDEVIGARLGDGRAVSAATTVLCAGAWSVDLAADAGLQLPIRPTAVKLAFFSRTVSTHLAVIDAPNGTYLRPDGPAATLVGRRTWSDEPLAGATADLPAVDEAFLADAHARLRRRLPSAAAAHVLATRAGMLDMTPDGRPLAGPSERPGLWLCCGWSGTGFKTGPPIGAALATWIAGGAAPPALASMHPGRTTKPAAGSRSPH